MRLRAMMLGAAILAITLCVASMAHADPWPQSAISDYFSSCVTIHKERWRDVPEAVVTRLCTCKVSRLQRYPWEQFAKANKEVNSYYLEQYVALPPEHQVSLFDDAETSIQAVLFIVTQAEEECAPK